MPLDKRQEGFLSTCKRGRFGHRRAPGGKATRRHSRDGVTCLQAKGHRRHRQTPRGRGRHGAAPARPREAPARQRPGLGRPAGARDSGRCGSRRLRPSAEPLQDADAGPFASSVPPTARPHEPRPSSCRHDLPARGSEGRGPARRSAELTSAGATAEGPGAAGRPRTQPGGARAGRGGLRAPRPCPAEPARRTEPTPGRGRPPAGRRGNAVPGWKGLSV